MAFGDGDSDEALQRAWREFCERLAEAGERVFKNENPAAPQHRADAFRFLTQNLGQAFDLALETRNTRYPALHAFCGPSRKLGGDCADFTYHQAWLDGESVYRVHGHRGTARFINFTVQGARPALQPGTEIPSLHDPFGDIPEANLFGHQIETREDGSFELFIGGPERGANWLPTTAETRKLFLRQGFDRWDEKPARLVIERLDMAEPRPLPDPAEVMAAMDWAGTFVESVMSDWPDHPYRYSPFVDPVNVNAFPAATAAGGDDARRGRAAANMCWELAPDETLLVEFEAPETFWMLSNMGVFFNSMDYLYRPVSYTPSRTAVDADGRVRLVLSHSDPGVHNWLDTQGFERGNLTWRDLLSTRSTDFVTRLVPLAELDAALPAGTRRATPDERRMQLWERFRGVRLRYPV